MKDKSRKELINILSRLDTEKVNPDTIDIDILSPLEMVKKISAEDKKVAKIVESQLPAIAEAGQIAAKTLKKGGRIIYIGAGTSGRLGVLDAAECPPTFGVDPSQVVGVISGGYDTLVLSEEGVEDRVDEALTDLKRIGLSPKDFLIGIAASVRTPYTQAGIEYGIETGCKTALVVCNSAEILKVQPDVIIELKVGPEVITGSTRMKAGTAQKMTLNMITTTAMILMGKTYGNLMVDLKSTSEKLAARSRKILIELLKVDYNTADKLLIAADGSVKAAIVMHKMSVDLDEARNLLNQADGFLKKVIES
jgi:N-acetylmuramic acid 6-phosphate etherase